MTRGYVVQVRCPVYLYEVNLRGRYITTQSSDVNWSTGTFILWSVRKPGVVAVNLDILVVDLDVHVDREIV